MSIIINGIVEKRKKILKKLAKKDPRIIENIRKTILKSELKMLRESVKKMSNKDLFDYWDALYDSNLDVVPKKTQKTLTDNEKKEFL